MPASLSRGLAALTQGLPRLLLHRELLNGSPLKATILVDQRPGRFQPHSGGLPSTDLAREGLWITSYQVVSLLHLVQHLVALRVPRSFVSNAGLKSDQVDRRSGNRTDSVTFSGQGHCSIIISGAIVVIPFYFGNSPDCEIVVPLRRGSG